MIRVLVAFKGVLHYCGSNKLLEICSSSPNIIVVTEEKKQLFIIYIFRDRYGKENNKYVMLRTLGVSRYLGSVWSQCFWAFIPLGLVIMVIINRASCPFLRPTAVRCVSRNTENRYRYIHTYIFIYNHIKNLYFKHNLTKSKRNLLCSKFI